MRHALLLPFALAALAACADSPVAPGPGTHPGSPRSDASADADGGALFASEPRTIAWNEGGVFYAQNLPLPDLGGGRVVWQDASGGEAAVLAYDLATGERERYGAVSGNFAYPVTAGRYTVWSSGGGTLYLRDAETGSVREIGPGAGYSARVSPQGRVAYLDFSAGVGNVAVYDATTGATRLLTHYTPSTAEAAREVDVDPLDRGGGARGGRGRGGRASTATACSGPSARTTAGRSAPPPSTG